MQVIRTGNLTFRKFRKGEGLEFPFLDVGVSAGFPSPADDFMENRISLDELLVDDPDATFFVTAHGDSMIGAGISDGDLMLVDRSKTPKNGRIAICSIDGEFTVKRIQKDGNQITLLSGNPKYKPIVVEGESTLIIWGVVSKSIKDLLK